MKIVELIPSLHQRGGAEVLLLSLSSEFKKMNNNVVVITLYDVVDDKIIEFLIKNNITLYTCGKKRGIDLKASRRLSNYINIINPDVIHLHLNVISSFYLKFFFKKIKFKVFLTIHNLFTKDFNFIERFVIRQKAYSGQLGLVGISDLITNDVSKYIKKPHIFTIYNGAYLFSPSTHKETDHLTIVNIATFRAQKNHKLLLDSFNEIYKKGFNNIILVLVGGGELFDYYVNYSEKLECHKNVFFRGKQNDVLPYLKNADIFCLSSSFEGNPISIIEAMSVGLPIIAPSIGGIPDVVIDKENGFLFNVDNKQDLISKLLELINNPNLRAIMRKNNIKRSKEYDISKCAKEYYKIFIGE